MYDAIDQFFNFVNDAIDQFFNFVKVCIAALVTSAIFATIFHYLWPYSIPTLYPTWVQNGYIPGQIGWFTAFATFEVISIISNVLGRK